MTTPTSEYHRIIRDVLDNGVMEPNRTGINAITNTSAEFNCDTSLGFPAITTKRLYIRKVKVELEGFCKAKTDKKWYQDRQCDIWDEWCRPDIIPYGHGEDRFAAMKAERDLGPIYGFQWRHFGAEYKSYDSDYSNEGVDQLKKAIDDLRKDPHNRRIIVQAWNPAQIHMMALPACHTGFQLMVTSGKLDLIWSQRSCDLMLGIPFNIACYAILQHLIARDVGMQTGRLVGKLTNVHIYENHLEGAREQLSRDPERHAPPTIVTEGESTSLFDWDHTMTKLVGYEHDPAIKMEVAI